MSYQTYTDAFRHFKAALSNPNWAISAINERGELVIACWDHLFSSPERGRLVYADCLSRWAGNVHGNNLLRSHLEAAVKEGTRVRPVIAKADNVTDLNGCADASKVKKTFHVRDDLVGSVSSFDGDAFEIEFSRAA